MSDAPREGASPAEPTPAAPRPPRRSLSRRVKAFSEPRVMAARRHLSPPRALPDFIIFGARKCGTTFLYANLVRQRGFLAAYKKEVRFFDKDYLQGEGWYRAHFPTLLALRWAGTGGRRALTGESSPLYLFDPRAAERIRAMVPQVRLIALLRNPVDRAYSQYEHHARRGRGEASFERAIEVELAMEAGRLAEERSRMLAEPGYTSELRQVYSCLSGGIYVDQLADWYARFPKEQILLVKAEEMYRDPQAVLARATEFLGRRPQSVRIVRENRKHGYPKMNPETRQRLEAFFAPHNARFYRFLEERGVAFAPWEG